MVECNECKRVFSGAAALAQHRKDKHPAARPRRRRRSRRVRNANLSGVGLDINPSRSGRAPGVGAVLSGEDRVGLFSVPAKYSTYRSIPVIPGVSERLSNLSKAYQRIKWLSVRVTVTPQCPLTVSGGYVAGFIMDPDDTAVTAQQLTSAQGSVTRKWFESSTVVMPPKPDLLYTSSSEELRFSSPGNFWIISEGNPSQDIVIVVTMSWRVRLETPTSEGMNDLSFTMSGKVVPLGANYNLQWAPLGGDAKTDCSGAVPPKLLSMPGYHYFRVPTFTIEYSEGTGDTGTVQAHFLVYFQKDKKFYYSNDGQSIGTTPWQSGVDIQTLVPNGTVCKYTGQGNEIKALAPASQPFELRALSSLLRSLLPSLTAESSPLKCSNISRSSSQESLKSWTALSRACGEEKPTDTVL